MPIGLFKQFYAFHSMRCVLNAVARTSLILPFLLISRVPVLAQPFIDIASVYYFQSRPEFLYQNMQHQSTTAGISINVPLKLKTDVLLLSPAAEQIRFHHDGFDERKDFQLISLNMSYHLQWKDLRHKSSLVFIGRNFSESDVGPSKLSQQFGIALLHSIKKNKNLCLKFGGYYNSEFFGPYFLPLLGLEWHLRNGLILHGVLPGSMNLEWKLHDRVRTGILFRSLTNSILIEKDKYLRQYENQFRLFADVYASKSHVLFFEAGHSVFRKYKTGEKGTRTDAIAIQFPDGTQWKIGYAFRIRTEAGND